jgi:hypothetical protein
MEISSDLSGNFLYCAKNNTLGFKELYQDFAIFHKNEISCLQQTSSWEINKLPKKYTFFGDGISSDMVYKLTATADINNGQLSTLYEQYIIDGITSDEVSKFDTTKFNVVEQGTIVYNKITGKKFYFIDKNFIQF